MLRVPGDQEITPACGVEVLVAYSFKLHTLICFYSDL